MKNNMISERADDMDSQQNSCIKTEEYLECEKRRVFVLMILVGGYLGAFTYSIRGGVFCNAQTGNFVLLAMALGNGSWFHALYKSEAKRS